MNSANPLGMVYETFDLDFNPTQSSNKLFVGEWELIFSDNVKNVWVRKFRNWLKGAGTPSNSLGENGDFYCNTANGDYYKKVSGVWVKINIVGGSGGGSIDLSNYYNKGEVDTRLTSKINTSEKGAVNGVAELGGDGKVKSTQLPVIPAEQIQSDWNQTSTSAKDFIKNKPDSLSSSLSNNYGEMISISCTANTASNYLYTFNQTYNTPPVVVACVQGTAQNSVGVTSITTAGCRIQVTLAVTATVVVNIVVISRD